MKKVCNFCAHYDYEIGVCLALDELRGYTDLCKNPLFFEMNLNIVEELINFVGEMETLLQSYSELNRYLSPVMYKHEEKIKAYNAFVTVHNECMKNKMCDENCLYFNSNIEDCVFTQTPQAASLEHTKLANLI